MKVKINHRLSVLATFIDEKDHIIDVGCDHALLDIYCALNKNTTCIAIDINKNALSSAINNINKYKLNDQIKPVLNKGLDGIDDFTNSVVVIAGMGTSNILNIIKDKKIEHLIIQSNNELWRLRREIIKKGYIINKEQIVKEGKIYNVIISFIRGNKKYHIVDYMIGPIIRTKKLDINQEYIKQLIFVNQEIINRLPKHLFARKLKLSFYNYLLKRELV